MGLKWRSRLQGALSRQADGKTPGVDATAEQGARKPLQTRQIPLGDIDANPHQPRQTVDDEALRDLADSIVQHGVLQPILVRQSGERYQLIAGQRRLRAAQMAGLHGIPAVVAGANDEESGVLALVENLQREGLCFLEEAAAYERLVRDFALTQEELARQLGKSQSTIANKLRLLRLPDEVRQRLAGSAFSERHARALLSLREGRTQLRVVEEIEAKGLTVRQTEALVARLAAEEAAGGTVAKAKPAQNWRLVFRDARILTNTFRAAVDRLEQSGMKADMEEIEHDQGLEIRVLVHLPAGWREGTASPGVRQRKR